MIENQTFKQYLVNEAQAKYAKELNQIRDIIKSQKAGKIKDISEEDGKLVVYIEPKPSRQEKKKHSDDIYPKESAAISNLYKAERVIKQLDFVQKATLIQPKEKVDKPFTPQPWRIVVKLQGDERVL